MPITINANSIVFPDSTIQSGPSTVVKFTRITNNTRQSFPSSGTAAESGAIFWSPAYTKSFANTNLYIEIDLSMRGNYSDHLTHLCNYAGSPYFQGTMPYDAGFSANSRPYHSTFLLTGIRNTGSNTLNFSFRCQNGGNSGEYPASVWNPNSSDDGRYNQEYSAIHVYEILPIGV